RPPVGHFDAWPEELRPDLTKARVAISRTYPATPSSAGVREVEALYLDMIRAARRYIYIENQYFSSHKIAAALAASLQAPVGPEIVLVVRRLSHGWLEELVMNT